MAVRPLRDDEEVIPKATAKPVARRLADDEEVVPGPGPARRAFDTAGDIARNVNMGILTPFGLQGPVSDLTGIGAEKPGETLNPATGAARAVGGAMGVGTAMLAAPLAAMGQGGVVAGNAAANIARQGVQAGIRPAASYFAREAAQKAAMAPGAFFSIELGAAAAGGAAGGAVMQETNNPTAAFVAEMAAGTAVSAAGPMAVAAAKAMPVVQLVKGTYGMMTGEPSRAGRRRALQRTGRALDASLSPSGEDVLARADAARGAVLDEAGFTLAELADSPGLLSLQKSIAKEAEALELANQARFADINRLSAETLRAPVTGSERVAPDEARQFLDTLLQERIRVARVAVDEQLASLGPNVTREQANRLARVELDKAYTAARAQETELWSQVPDDVRTTMARTSEAMEGLLREIASDRSAARRMRRDMPREAMDLIGRMDPETGAFVPGELGNDASLREIQTLRSTLLEMASAERAKDVPNRRLIRNADILQEAILGDISAVDAKGASAVARAFSRDLNTRFRQGEVGDILGFERTGEGFIDPSLTLERTLGRSGMAASVAANKLTEAVQRSGDPEAMTQHITDFLLDEFMRAARTSGGDFSPERASTYLARRQDLLANFPEAQRRMMQAVETGRVSVAAEGMLKPKESAAAIVLGARPGDEIARLARSQNPRQGAQEIMQLLDQDPSGRARAGMQQSVFDWILDRATTRGIDGQGNEWLSGASMRRAMQEPSTAAILEEVLTPAQIERLNKVQATLIRLDRARSAIPSTEGVMGDKEGLLATLVRRVGAAALGRKVGRDIGAGGTVQIPGQFSRVSDELANRGIDPARKILIDAMTDPSGKLLRALIQEAPRTRGRQQYAQRQLNAWAAATAIEYGMDALDE